MLRRAQWAFQVSQRSVEILFRWREKRLFNFAANLLRKLRSESLEYIRRYYKNHVGLFFMDTVYKTPRWKITNTQQAYILVTNTYVYTSPKVYTPKINRTQHFTTARWIHFRQSGLHIERSRDFGYTRWDENWTISSLITPAFDKTQTFYTSKCSVHYPG